MTRSVRKLPLSSIGALAWAMMKVLLPVGGEIIQMVGDAALLDLAIGRFQEAEVVDCGEGCQRSDQTDVRPFRRFDRANAAIVRRMNVADLESRAVAGQDRQARGPKGGACASTRPAG